MRISWECPSWQVLRLTCYREWERYTEAVSSIAANLQKIEGQVSVAARRVGRDLRSVQILAVSKTFPHQAVEEAHRSGHSAFGENRVQEAAAKIPLCPEGIEWHLIGPLQSNKARTAVQLFDVIQTLDRPRIVHKTGRAAEDQGKELKVYLEVNVGGEAQKHGSGPDDLPRLLEALEQHPSLHLQGLMCIPPYSPDPKESRPFFRQLRSLLEQVNRSRPEPLNQLSMGMSRDYEIAIQEGATLIRVGTAIFGPRRAR